MKCGLKFWGLGVLMLAIASPAISEKVSGFSSWRGPTQDGHVASVVVAGELDSPAWMLDLSGRGTPVIGRYADRDRMFVLGYTGGGADLLEVIVCLDPATGKEHWRRGYADFISDIIYSRYSIGAPTIDPATGDVYFMTSPGLLVCIDKDGNEKWQVSMMDTYGRLTFPNGRTGSVTIDGDLAIVNAITTNWGSEGPARNRFYAFDKTNGQLVWSSTPGVGPPFLKDSSFSTPYIENRGGVRLFYVGTGCGNVAAVNIRNGQPMWRYQMSYGGVNCSPVVHPGPDGNPGTYDDLILQTHGKENLSDTGRGFMVALKAGPAFASAIASEDSPVQLTQEHVAWRNDDVSMFTSSPTLVGDTVYQCTTDGHLVAINVLTGETRWKLKVGGDQLHASPLALGGKLYVPYWNDGLFVVTPPPADSDAQPTVEHIEVAGQSIGSPAVFNGMLFVHTTEKLYAFGKQTEEEVTTKNLADAYSAPVGMAVKLRVTPSEFLLRPNDTQVFTATAVDGNGHAIAPVLITGLEKWIPPTAKVKVELVGEVKGDAFIAAEDGQPSAGALKAIGGEAISGTTRGRVLKTPPFSEDFYGFELNETDAGDDVKYAYPPLPWIGARLKWQVRELDGEQVFAKTLDRTLFQRSTVFMGHPDDSDYELLVDVMTDGNRRLMGVVGVVNQRYIIALDGNKRVIEVSSNHDRVKLQAKFSIKPKTWYRMRTRVDVNDDGSGVVRGKAWPRGEDEPEAWTIEAEVPRVHTHGAPGLFGFSPQSRYRVYLDNVVVTPKGSE